MEFNQLEIAELDIVTGSEEATAVAEIAEIPSEFSLEAVNLLSVADADNTTSKIADSEAELKSLTSDAVLKASDSIISPISVKIGTPKPDILIGTKGADFIFGLESGDFILAQEGDDKIYGGSGDDFAFGDGGNDEFRQWSGNRFVDGSGNDILIGGDGKDTADYRYFNQAITLEAGGRINKGKSGTDQFFDVEVVKGTLNKSNSIDASTTGGNNASIEANLFSENLLVKNVPTLGNLSFTVENFVNVTGTNNDDKITGDNKNNRLSGLGGNDNIFGFGGNDTVDGGNGNDFIRGDAGNDTVKGGAGDDTVQGGWGDDHIVGVGDGSQPGAGEVDVLTGGFPWIFPSPLEVEAAVAESSVSGFKDLSEIETLAESSVSTAKLDTQVDSLTRESLSVEGGTSLVAEDRILFPTFLDRDKFVLGNSKTSFYLDESPFGLDGYAYITDFQSGFDKIQLEGSASDYLFTGSSLIFRNNGFAGLDPKDDLVGFVGGSGFNAKTDLSFVG
ncbi:MAG: calcium-binding protein [Microcoleaceae cyanobacterium]